MLSTSEPSLEPKTPQFLFAASQNPGLAVGLEEDMVVNDAQVPSEPQGVAVIDDSD